jgi:hypothetical protein
MLNRDQEDRLRKALSVLMAHTPERGGPPAPHTLQPATSRRRPRPLLVGALAFLVVAVAFVPILLSSGHSRTQSTGGSPGTTATPTSTDTIPTTTTPVPTVLALGDVEVMPVQLGVTSSMRSYDGALYASQGDQVLALSSDGTATPLLEAVPGDGEGLFAVGHVIMQIIEDDSPTRGSVSPDSAVTGPLTVQIYDPISGSSWTSELPRPEDPSMSPIPADAPDSCALGGYQSWVLADAGAVGDSLIVAGHLFFVGMLPDGTYLCDGESVPYIWTSGDDGHTWQIHQGPALSSIQWTGNRFVAWSASVGSPSAERVLTFEPQELLTSPDGLEWTSVATTPPLPTGTILGGSSLARNGDIIVGWSGVSRWTALDQIPETVTDPGQLQDVFFAGTDVESTLARIGVDLPLDETDRLLIAQYVGTVQPISASVAVSTDAGQTWTTRRIDKPVVAVVPVDGGFVAVTNGGMQQSRLLTSSDGATWQTAGEVPGGAVWSGGLASTGDSVYVLPETGHLWKIPVR